MVSIRYQNFFRYLLHINLDGTKNKFIHFKTSFIFILVGKQNLLKIKKETDLTSRRDKLCLTITLKINIILVPTNSFYFFIDPA